MLPFRVIEPREAVLPVTDKGILTSDEIEFHDGLSAWWSTAEESWAKYKAKSESRPFLERLDHHGQLAAQFPIAPVRIAFTKTGTVLAAAIIREPDAIIDHSLYWMPVMVEAEAHYLTAILNSAPLLSEVKPLQAIGLYGARHFDKNVFAVPFPTYDNRQSLHVDLATLGKEAEEAAATVDVSGVRRFQAARRLIREHLAETGIEARIVEAVTQLLLATASQE
ncbi:hypothetical protein H7J07_06800 [Mycobacterium koreense]|uniref:hypothetical protein n=1 Tax=Mycolicibacillus koreensis TaxID=1069220 RepID=UPI001055F91C|nr:hypothetical protein [Mycolicibacillus koreensis]MCV7247928.1 hypothetical protein [Mycolicibacillus koreensis]